MLHNYMDPNWTDRCQSFRNTTRGTTEAKNPIKGKATGCLVSLLEIPTEKKD